MNQGGADTTVEQNSSQSHQIVNPGNGCMSSYNSPSGENGMLSYPNHHQDQHADPSLKYVQDGSGVSSVPATSNGDVNVPQGYTSYTAHTNTDQYGYGTNGYTGYYGGYQQQQQLQQQQHLPPPPPLPPNQQYSQPVGAYQNTGAPHQPISSFQNTGSYAAPMSYSGTYYNTADYQTTDGYSNGSYNNQTTTWTEGNHATYGSNQYPCYAPDPNVTNNVNAATDDTSSQYQQHYQQWADYYSQTEVSCAPGTENVSVSSTPNPVYPTPVTSGYSASFSHPSAPYVPPWGPDNSSDLPPVQTATATSAGHDGYWTNGTANDRNHDNSSEPPQSHKPIDSSSNYQTLQDSQKTTYPQPTVTYPQPNIAYQQPDIAYQQPNIAYQQPNTAYQQPNTAYQQPNTAYQQPNTAYQQPNSPYQQPNSPYQQPNTPYQQPNTPYQQPNTPFPATHQVTPSYLPPSQTYQQAFPPLESRRVSNLKIPKNPRIISNITPGLPKTSTEGPVSSAVSRPAYIGVSLPKPSAQASPHHADSIPKPGKFPKSLQGYVERVLARCKDDTQKEACQSILKEIITKANTDGSITRDWDTEPLFPIPITHMTNKDLLGSSHLSLLSKSKRSPSRRTKSRWEPIIENKPVDNVASVTPDSAKYGGMTLFSGSGKKLPGGNLENKDFNVIGNKKFSLLEHRITRKNTKKPFKRQRLGDIVDGGDNSEVSSGSDKEQSLTAYYSGAITLSDSTEEKRRREHRSKRFDKGPGKRTEHNHYKPKGAGAGNMYSRRATAMVLSKTLEEGGGNRAVEDIDWDALTVKGTYLEIEKCYLRLTSAPDPATVRPEEVLEKALLMVQNSQKNYLYKFDQLKSIRQDLTVQRIRNELTVKVYETHARLAIEAGDLSECNQCQSQLKTLYAEGIKGCHMEFAAYDLLRAISHSSNNRDLLSAMSRLSIETKGDEAVKHALSVRAAVTSGNYVSFFRLYKTAPNLNTFLMDLYVEKMRYSAVRCMSRSYRPIVPVSYIAQVLGFGSSLPTAETAQGKDSNGLEECAEWLKAHGACLIVDNSGEMQLDSKASSTTLYMPEPEDAVAHGDASLAVNDFLAKNKS